MTQPDPPAPTPAPTPAPPAPTPAPEPEKTLTQSEVNRIAAREKDEGKAAALREVQESLGIDLEAAKQILKEHNERNEAQKTEAQKARDAADKERAEAVKERAAATREIHDARVDRAFVGAGLTDVDKVARYSKMLDVAVGASPEDISKAVESLKKEEPSLFGGTPAPKLPAAPGSDPKGKPPTPKNDEDAYARGAARALGHRSAFTAVKQPAPADTSRP